jgi:protein-S-isoprenylcysteine O-methyltransferase Ste14
MQRVARVAIFVERYILSLLFLWFAWRQSDAVRQAMGVWFDGVHLAFAGLVNHLLIFILQLVCGLALLLSKTPGRLPEKWSEITVPLLGTFYYLGYNFAGNIPGPWSQNLAPAAWQSPLAGVALLLSCAGFAIAVWGATYLGRSFAVLVAVRDVVHAGPYRFVRHPIYCGYVLHVISLWLSRTSPFMALLIVGHLAITVWRARLEEASLQAHSEEYRRYAERTGFLFPRRLW